MCITLLPVAVAYISQEAYMSLVYLQEKGVALLAGVKMLGNDIRCMLAFLIMLSIRYIQ